MFSGGLDFIPIGLYQSSLNLLSHIHEAWGAKIISYGLEDVVCVNAALAHVGTRAIIIDLRN